jgi:hypothetical protein
MGGVQGGSPVVIATLVASAADDVAVVDGPADQGPGPSTKDGAQRLRATGSDDVPEYRPAHTADNQAGGAIVAPAVVAVVGPPVNAIVSAQTSGAVAAIVASVVRRRIPVAAALLVAIVPAIPSVFPTISTVFPAISPVFLSIASIFPAIPAVFVPIAALVAPSLRSRGQRADE